AVDHRLLQGVAVKGEQQETHAWSAVRCFIGGKLAFDASLGVAADDRRGVAGCDLAGRLRPAGRFGRDNQPGGRHGKRLGEGVLNRDVVDGKQAVAPLGRRKVATASALRYPALTELYGVGPSLSIRPTVMKQSAGTLLYRHGPEGIEVLLVHPS